MINYINFHEKKTSENSPNTIGLFKKYHNESDFSDILSMIIGQMELNETYRKEVCTVHEPEEKHRRP